MAPKRSSRSARQPGSTRSLMVRLDEESKSYLTRAADLRGISVSDHVRLVTVAQARCEVESAGEQVIALTPGEQIAFWNVHAPTSAVNRSSSQARRDHATRGEA